jgi:uncharacterized ferredoxin-like protein
MITNPESENIEVMAKMILTAARTAPKAKGRDSIVTGLLEPSDINIRTNRIELWSMRFFHMQGNDRADTGQSRF